jgi:hypothetical protein
MQRATARMRPDTLEYVQSMLRELRGMAEGENCPMLVYLLEMAYIEASDLVRNGQPEPGCE